LWHEPEHGAWKAIAQALAGNSLEWHRRGRGAWRHGQPQPERVLADAGTDASCRGATPHQVFTEPRLEARSYQCQGPWWQLLWAERMPGQGSTFSEGLGGVGPLPGGAVAAALLGGLDEAGVEGMGSNDCPLSSSNFGRGVDLYAPGVCGPGSGPHGAQTRTASFAQPFVSRQLVQRNFVPLCL
jgi:hypothetical protein